MTETSAGYDCPCSCLKPALNLSKKAGSRLLGLRSFGRFSSASACWLSLKELRLSSKTPESHVLKLENSLRRKTFSEAGECYFSSYSCKGQIKSMEGERKAKWQAYLGKNIFCFRRKEAPVSRSLDEYPPKVPMESWYSGSTVRGAVYP